MPAAKTTAAANPAPNRGHHEEDPGIARISLRSPAMSLRKPLVLIATA